MIKILLFIISSLLLSSSIASFRPDEPSWNDFVSKSNATTRTKISETQVQTIKDEIQTSLATNFELKILAQSRINAFASLSEDNTPKISVTTGMINHDKMSKNVLKLLICHELGHVFGGFPKQFRGRSNLKSWSTAEGQADYYSILVCAKKLNFDKTEKKYLYCQGDSNCHAMTEAALKLSQIYAEIKFWPYELSIDDPDRNIVHTTELAHPNPQCRLDTFIHAIKCLNLSKKQKEGRAFYTCLEMDDRQPPCWMAPNTFQDI